MEPHRAKLLVQAICVLHNFLQYEKDPTYNPPGMADVVVADDGAVEGFWRTETPDVANASSSAHNCSIAAVNVREDFARYFMTPAGSVQWQMDHINQR